MGLLTIIRKARLKERQVRVLMLFVHLFISFRLCGTFPTLTRAARRRMLVTVRSGLDNAGKTTICKALLGEDVDQVSPTLGFNIRTIVHNGYTLNVCECLFAAKKQ